MPSLNIKDYILAALFFALLGMWWVNSSLKDDLKDMTTKRDIEASKLIVSKSNETSLKNAIILQSEIIEQDKIDTEKRHKAFIESIKPKIVTKYINKYIKDIDENSSECENINSILDNVISNGL